MNDTSVTEINHAGQCNWIQFCKSWTDELACYITKEKVHRAVKWDKINTLRI